MSSEKKIIKWFIFGGVSTFLAFFLPAYLWAMANSYRFNVTPNIFTEVIIFFLFLCFCLWHGKYRAETLTTDFAPPKQQKNYKTLITFLYYLGLILLIIINLPNPNPLPN